MADIESMDSSGINRRSALFPVLVELFWQAFHFFLIQLGFVSILSISNWNQTKCFHCLSVSLKPRLKSPQSPKSALMNSEKNAVSVMTRKGDYQRQGAGECDDRKNLPQILGKNCRQKVIIV